MEKSTFDAIKYSIFCIGVPVAIYLIIKWNPVTGHDEEGEPTHGLSMIVLLAMMIGCYMILRSLEIKGGLDLEIAFLEQKNESLSETVLELKDEIDQLESGSETGALIEQAQKNAEKLYSKYIDKTDLKESMRQIKERIRESDSIEFRDAKGELLILMGKYFPARCLYWSILEENPNYLNAYLQILKSYSEEETEKMMKYE
jgi:tetratricopeptide (TPR) repeat protein